MVLGLLSPTSREIGAHNVTVHSNGSAGYTVHVSRRSTTTGANGHVFADVPGTNSSPLPWPGSGTEGLGYTTSAVNLSGTPTRFSGPLWAAFTTGAGEVMYRASPVPDGDSACVAIAASRAGNTPAGVYNATITYTLVAAF